MPLSASTSPSCSQCHKLLATFCGSKPAPLRPVEACSVPSPLPTSLDCCPYSAMGASEVKPRWAFASVATGAARIRVLPPAKAAIFLPAAQRRDVTQCCEKFLSSPLALCLPNRIERLATVHCLFQSRCFALVSKICRRTFFLLTPQGAGGCSVQVSLCFKRVIPSQH